MNDIQPPKRSKTPSIVVLLTLGVVATFGAILWSASGPSVPVRSVGLSDEAKQTRDEWNQQRASLQEAMKNLEASQQKMASEMEDLKRQISREAGERKQLSDQVGSLSARVDGLSTANASTTASPRKKR